MKNTFKETRDRIHYKNMLCKNCEKLGFSEKASITLVYGELSGVCHGELWAFEFFNNNDDTATPRGIAKHFKTVFEEVDGQELRHWGLTPTDHGVYILGYDHYLLYTTQIEPW